MHLKLPSSETILKKLSFNPSDGLLRHLFSMKRAKAGEIAGTIRSGYRFIKINGKTYSNHRITWLLSTGVDPNEMEVDHINRNPCDNRPINLRLVTKSQNQCNSKTRKDNISGERGVYWYKPRGKWQVSVKLNGRDYFGGRFDSLERAKESAKELRNKLHGQYAAQTNYVSQ